MTSEEENTDKEDIVDEQSAISGISREDKERKEILKLWNEAQEQFDKQLVYLSGGALVLSMGFVTDIVKITEKTDTCLLVWSWGLFASSLISNLFSHKVSYYSMHFQLKNYNIISDICDIITEVLNWGALITLISGIITFIIFIHQTI